MRFSSFLPVASLSRSMVLAFTLFLAACSSPEERARAHYASGQELLESGDFTRAGLEFRNAVNFDDKFVDAWFGLANVEEKKENWGAALESFKRVVELDPNRTEARAKLAKLQFVGGDLDAALTNVNLVNEQKKNDTHILALRAAILFRLGDREGARADAESSLAIEPNNPDAHAVMAADALIDKNTAGALLSIDRGLAGDPSNIGLLLFKIKIFDAEKDDAKLEAVLRQVITYHPKIKEMRQTLMKFLADRKRFAEVETEMRTMIAEEPDNTALALDLVRFISRTKDAASARAELEQMIAAHPGTNAYLLARAELDFTENKTDAAVAALDAIIAKGEPSEDVARARLLLASMRLKMKDLVAGKALIEQVIASDAKNTDALLLRAGVKLDAGDADGAVGDLREALNQRPQSIPILTLLARAHESQGAVDIATEHFTQAARLSNFDPRVVVDYASFLDRHGKKDQAEAALNEALARYPEDRGLLVAVSRFRIAHQDWEGAQKISEALKKIGDTSGIGDQILATSLIGQKKFDESIAIFKNTQEASPDQVRPMKNLVVAYLQAGKAGEALTFLDTVLKANDKNAEAHVLYGLVKNTQKKSDEAEAAYRKAIEVQPTSPVGYAALAQFQVEAQQLDQALETLRLGYSKAPGDQTIALALAGLLERKNDIDGAIAIYEEQLKASPDALVLINNVASLIADHREDAASLDHAHAISRRLTGIEMPQFKDTLGWLAYRRGEYQAAFELLSDAATKAPAFDIIRYHLAMTHLALKRPAEAKELLTAIDAKLKDGDPLKEKVRAGLASASETKQSN